MKKKIYLIIALSLIGIILASTIVLAFTTKDYMIDANFSPLTVGIYHNGSNTDFGSETEVYENIINKLNESFKTSYLKSLFQGKAGVKPTVKHRNSSTIPGINFDGSYENTSYTYVQLIYNQHQLIRENGQNYNDNGTKSYLSLFIEITNTNKMHDVNIYYRNESNFLYYYTLTMANQHDLYEYISDLSF